MNMQRKRRSDAGKRRSDKPADATYSFKLNVSDEDELAAMEVIEEYQGMGLRKLITLALLNFDGRSVTGRADIQSLGLEELTERFHDGLEQLEQIVNQLSESGASLSPGKSTKPKKRGNISLDYLSNLKQALRN